jgi:hypothetical protein
MLDRFAALAMMGSPETQTRTLSAPLLPFLAQAKSDP